MEEGMMYTYLEMFIYHISKVMKKSAFFLLTVILSVILYSCVKGSLSDLDLGNGYRLSFTGHSRDAYNSDIISPTNGLLVHSTVLDYVYDSTFIIAIQRPWNYPIPNRYTLNYHELRKEMDKITFRQYWIINKAEKCEYLGYIGDLDSDSRAIYSNVYGPFQREEYLLKREELGVPYNLVLKEDTIK